MLAGGARWSTRSAARMNDLRSPTARMAGSIRSRDSHQEAGDLREITVGVATGSYTMTVRDSCRSLISRTRLVTGFGDNGSVVVETTRKHVRKVVTRRMLTSRDDAVHGMVQRGTSQRLSILSSLHRLCLPARDSALIARFVGLRR